MHLYITSDVCFLVFVFVLVPNDALHSELLIVNVQIFVNKSFVQGDDETTVRQLLAGLPRIASQKTRKPFDRSSVKRT